MISSFRKLWTTAGLIVVVALALFSAPGAFAAGVGGAQFALTNTSAQVSTSSLLVNSVQFRPVSGQQCPISVYYGGVLPQNLLAVINPYPVAGAGAMDSYSVTNSRGDDAIQLNQFFVSAGCSWETTQVLVSWLQTGQVMISQFTPFLRGVVYPSGSNGHQLCQSCALAQYVQFRQYRWNAGNVHVNNYVYPATTLAILAAWKSDSRPVTDSFTIASPPNAELVNPASLAVSVEQAGDGVIVVAWG